MIITRIRETSGLVFFWLVLLLAGQARALENQLVNHPSPYLALHGSDPVAWQEWNAGSVALARRENKLLLVSIGYFSCHWCHVMQKESYRNPDIAALLNRAYIPVKVDRELESGLDGVLQDFAERTRGQAGWPLNVFITPEGYPLLAVLYAPPQDFLATVEKLAARWQREAPQLAALARQSALVTTAKPVAPAQPNASLLAELNRLFIAEALARADLFRGGFGSVNKFPMSPQLAVLLEMQARAPQDESAGLLTLTLDQIMSQGLYDHVGGGFFRYTTDPDWRIPHFEKMLYDNAQLALVYLRAAEVFRDAAYRDTALATLDFMAATLQDPQTGGLIASTSAIDGQNREGAYYLWSRAELEKLLSPEELQVVEKTWRLDQAADFDYGYLPMQRVRPNEIERHVLATVYKKLAAQRSQRSLPMDTKQLAGLNGLALAAFSRAAQTTPRYRDNARRVRDFLVGKLWQQGALVKALSGGRRLGEGELEDYAYVAAGLAEYARLTASRDDRALSLAVLREGWRRFYTPLGWKTREASLLAGHAAQAAVADGPLPSPAAILIGLTASAGDEALRKQARQALAQALPEVRPAVFWHASYLEAMHSSLTAQPLKPEPVKPVGKRK